MSETSLKIHVTPRGSRNQVVGWRGGVLHIKLTAPPVEGAANAQLVQFMADVLGIRKRDIEIAGGERSREKMIIVRGMTADQIADRLGQPE